MPTPTSALWIMLQSFAPSPTASVMAFSTRLMSETTAPFCFGETRQQMTVLHTRQMATKSISFSGSKACSRHLPSITKPSSVATFLACSAYSFSFLHRSSAWNLPFTSNSPDVRIGLSFLSVLPGSSRLVATPMLIAVSILSPVSIQTLIPACTILDIVSPTWSCSRSSMPVMPCSSRLHSIASAAWSRAPWRSVVATLASLNLTNQRSSSSLLSSRPAKHSVRRPSSANSWRMSMVLEVDGDVRILGRSLSMITESAPLVKMACLVLVGPCWVVIS
mmetsp:Transcript_4981/g.12841  ORF Transcript_4981/g.12841 Transcript_4981/m.12841 type:complete len:277 (+) Transcript_4981:1357-2187(+)